MKKQQVPAQKGKAGRPFKIAWNEDTKKRLAELGRVGSDLRVVADEFGVDPRTLRYFFESYDEAWEAFIRARGKGTYVICDHLQAISERRLLRLLINLPPRHMKSLIMNVFWPAWTWANSGFGRSHTWQNVQGGYVARSRRALSLRGGQGKLRLRRLDVLSPGDRKRVVPGPLG